MTYDWVEAEDVAPIQDNAFYIQADWGEVVSALSASPISDTGIAIVRTLFQEYGPQNRKEMDTVLPIEWMSLERDGEVLMCPRLTVSMAACFAENQYLTRDTILLFCHILYESSCLHPKPLLYVSGNGPQGDDIPGLKAILEMYLIGKGETTDTVYRKICDRCPIFFVLCTSRAHWTLAKLHWTPTTKPHNSVHFIRHRTTRSSPRYHVCETVRQTAYAGNREREEW
jgi:hypothetical protein